jgi:hypothetical protein
VEPGWWGVRLAFEARFVSFILKDNVAVVEKKPIWITTGCGLLRVGRIGWKSSFLLRGGARLYPTDKLVKLEDKAYHVVAEKKFKYGTIMVADRMISQTADVRFEHPIVLKQGYLVFEVAENDAKLVDSEPTHILTTFEHSAYFKKAEIKITFEEKEGRVVFNDWTSCRQRAVALAIAIVPVNSMFTVCYNSTGNKYRCHKMIATVPPVILEEFFV